jgi:beta-N-acetylhexosaminidase
MININVTQQLIVGFEGCVVDENHPTAKKIRAREVAGVILFLPNVQSPSQVRHLTQQLRTYADQANLQDFIIGIDYEGGTVKRLPEHLGFPKRLSAQRVGSLSYADAKIEAEHMADTLVQLGFNLNFVPVVDLNLNPMNPILGQRERCFSADPEQVVAYAKLFIDAHRERGLACVLKHFPGHGSSTGDTHVGFVDVTDTWQEKELLPYQQLLQGADDRVMVMTAHVVHRGLDPKGLPASLSKSITTDLLRDKIGFRGKVIADDLQMRAISDHYSLEESMQLAIDAGADYLIVRSFAAASEAL